MKNRILAGLVIGFSCLTTFAEESRVTLKGGNLALTLPAGWKAAEKQPKFDDTLGAFQSEDNTSSLYVSIAQTRPEYSMHDVLDGVVRNYEEAFVFKSATDYKMGKIAGKIAIFTTLELEMREATSQRTMPFRFYLTVFDTGDTVYLIQASAQQPVKEERQKEIMQIIRSMENLKASSKTTG